MASEERRLLIIGGGIAGVATALFAHRAGIAAAVFEAAPEPTNLGGALGLAPNGVSVLGALGLAEGLIARSTPIDGFRFETAGGRKLGTMAWGPEGRYRYPSLSVSRHRLHAALLDAAAAAGIPIFYGKGLTGLDQDADGVTASFADGGTELGSAMVGADGIWSTVRRLILPNGPAPAFTGLIGSGGFLPRDAMREIVGTERERTITLSFGSGAFIGHAFGDRSEETGAYWWYALPRDAPLARGTHDPSGADLVDRLLSLEDWSETTRRILRVSTRTLPVFNLFDVAQLPRWSSERIGLIGDAAHAVSPHSGQGASMALEDAFSVVQALRAAPASPALAFQAFETARRDRVERVVRMGRRSGDQKRKGALGTALMTVMMPIMLRLMPRQTWLLGWEAR